MRWSEADIARVTSRLKQQIAKPLGIEPIQGGRRGARKYGNNPTMVDGYLFDSALEARRYGELKLLLMTGQIHDLRMQFRWKLHVNGIWVCAYLSDFDYLADGKRCIEDCKGVKTPLYRLKKKMVEAEYGLEIIEIFA